MVSWMDGHEYFQIGIALKRSRFMKSRVPTLLTQNKLILVIMIFVGTYLRAPEWATCYVGKAASVPNYLTSVRLNNNIEVVHRLDFTKFS